MIGFNFFRVVSFGNHDSDGTSKRRNVFVGDNMAPISLRWFRKLD